MRFLIITLLLTIAFSGVVAQPENQSPIPPDIEQAASEWPMANRDYANTRAALDAEISSANVNSLDVAWTVDIVGIGPWGAAASNPIIVNGVVYLQDLASNIYAVDFETGELLWFADYSIGVVGPNGPGAGYGKIYATTGVDTFAALSMETGEEVWSITFEDRATGANQPYAFGNMVLFGTQAGIGGEGERLYKGYEGGMSGFVMAFDQKTGEELWDFQVVEEGFWGNPEINSGGGLWYPPGIDIETGATFWGTGNPAPFPGTVDFPNGTSRPGDNLYTNTLLTLDYQSGEMLWYNQVLPHDIFDLDFQASPVLLTAEIDGQERDIVIGTGKLGIVYAFDRETGDIIWETPVGYHENDDLDAIPLGEVVVVFPGQLGGVETPISSADGVIYVQVGNWGTPYTATGWGAETGPESVPRSEGRMNPRHGTGEIVALDASTGEIIWLTEVGLGFGGTTVVNDLVFSSTLDGTLYALARENGELVWEYQAPGGVNAWPAVTRDTIIFPIGIGGIPVLLALRLGGDGAIPTPEQQPTPIPEETES